MSVPLNNRTTERKKRAVSLDLARGVMLLLIVLAHAPLYLYNSEPGIMQRVASESLLDSVVNLFGLFVIDNRARALFAVLFGYGLVLSYESQISKGKQNVEALKSIRRRAWFLILFGFLLAVFIGGQDILMAYGLAALLVSRLLTRENKALIRTFTIITLLYCLFTPILWGFNMQELKSYGFPPDVSASDTYFGTMLKLLFTFPIIPIMIHILFPVIPSVLLGMWMARYQLLTKPEHHERTLTFILLIGLTVSLLGAFPLSLLGSVWNPSYFTGGLLHGLHMLTGIVGGLAYAAAFGLIGIKLKKRGNLIHSLTALGKRSLTFYVWNEAMLVLFLSPVALDLGGRVSNGIAAFIAIGVWIFSVLLATLLEKKNWNGPLEILLRRLIYK